MWAPFHLDDFALLQDPVVTSPAGWWRVWAPAQTRPLTWFSFWLNWQSGGPQAAGYHLVNLLLHLASIVLLRGTLGKLMPAPAALAATAIFALHPIQTEAVAYVFARATLLMTLFCLLALRAWTGGRHWQAAAWFAPALLAKEECVSFPLFLLLLHLSISRNRRELAAIGAMLLMSLAAGLRVLHVIAVTAGSGVGAQSGRTSLDYFTTEGAVLVRYLRMLLFPSGFTPDPAVEFVGGWWALAAWLMIALLAVASLGRFGKAREGFWGLAALALIAPSSSIFPAADLAADRRVYLPLAAFAAAIGLLLARTPKWVLPSLGLLLAVLSFRQTLVWRSGESLWREAVRLAPGKVRPKIQLARQLPPAEALALLDEAQRLRPDDPAIGSEKGRVYLEMGKPSAALAEFGHALALAPGDARAVNNRGVALLKLGQKEAARDDFRRALEIDPCLFDARWNLLSLGHRHATPADCRYTPAQEMALQGR